MRNEKYHLKKMLCRLKNKKITPKECGLEELTREQAIKLIKEEIKELET
jgi:hypothetical protein